MSAEIVEKGGGLKDLSPEARRSLFAQFLFGEGAEPRSYAFWKELGQWADAEQLWPLGFEDDARIAVAMRLLLGLPRLSVGRCPPNAINAHVANFVAARRLFSHLPHAEAVPAAGLIDSAVMGVLRETIEWGFLEGRDVSAAIEEMLQPSRIYAFKMKDPEYLELCALCVWMGRRDLLEKLPTPTAAFGPAAEAYARFRSACMAIFVGNLLDADAGFEVLATSKFSASEMLLLTAANLLALTVHFQLHAAHQVRMLDAPKCFRLVRNLLLQDRAGEGTKLGLGCPAAEAAFAERQKQLSGICYTVSQLTGGESKSTELGSVDLRHPLGGLAFVLRFALLPVDERAKSLVLVPDVFQLAEVALAGGYPTLGALYVAVLGGSLPEGLRAQAVETQRRLEEAGAASVWPVDHPVEAWRTALDDLSEVLSWGDQAPKTAPQPKDAKISWKLVFSNAAPRQVLSVAPCLRRPRGAQDGTNDQEETLVSVSNGRYSPCMTDIDREVALSLLGAGYEIKRGTPVPLRTLEILCRHPRVVAPDERGILHEIAFQTGECPIRVETGAEGGLRLSLPFQGRIQKESYAILQTGPFSYSYVPLKPEVRAVVSVFSRHASSGVLEVPQEGLAQTQRMLRKALDRLPLVGALSIVTDLQGVDRVIGDSTAVVRLNWSGEVLEVSVWILPLPESQIPYFPGSGERESLVARNGRTVVLVRDFEAELEGLARVAAALEPFKEDYSGNGRWEVGSLDRALAVLSSLRTLGEGVRCEWSGRRRLGVRSAQRLRLKASSGISWFDVQGHLAVDEGMVFSVVDVLRRLGGRVGRFIAMGDDLFVELTEELQRKLDALQQAAQVNGSSVTVARAAVPMLEEAFTAEEDDLPEAIQLDAAIIRENLARKPVVPKTLKGKLRPYQKEGYSWLSRLAACSFGACLADDMGLGKTVQVISLLLERAENGVSLVVAPASVCLNWRKELARFAPSLTCVLANEVPADEEHPFATCGKGMVVVTSYGLLVSRFATFSEVAWNGVVLDESQAIKNEDTRRAQAVKELKSAFRVAATGTPVENNLTELWSLFDFLNPGLLGNVREFASRFVSETGTATEGLKKLVSPFILRRLKRDVLDDLPPKTEIVLPIPLDDEERSAYEGCRRLALESLMKVGADGKSQNRINILAQLMRLRRFCCHPSLVVPDLKKSSKMEVLLQLLEDLRANHHHALVFSQFTDYLTIVRQALEAKGWSYRYLDGAVSLPDRKRAEDEFQRGEADFFLISLKAGGLGLNLTAANYVILLDPWWNPAVEDQAADRAYRIGQKNPVTVYRLIVSNTVESRVVEMHGTKRKMADDLLDDASDGSLSTDELLSLFASE